MGSELAGTTYGSVPDPPAGYGWVERTQNDEITIGATYQVEGSIAQPLIWAFPESWLQDWIGYVYSFRHPKCQVTAVQLDSDGHFKIQFTALSGSPLILIVGALAAFLLILAGMSMERIFEAVNLETPPTGPVGAAKDIGFVLILGGLAAAAVWHYS
jgi:hypothetical protein